MQCQKPYLAPLKNGTNPWVKGTNPWVNPPKTEPIGGKTEPIRGLAPHASGIAKPFYEAQRGTIINNIRLIKRDIATLNADATPLYCLTAYKELSLYA